MVMAAAQVVRPVNIDVGRTLAQPRLGPVPDFLQVWEMQCAFVVDFCLAACIPGATRNFLNACGGQGLGAAPLAVCCRNQYMHLKTGACHELTRSLKL